MDNSNENGISFFLSPKNKLSNTYLDASKIAWSCFLKSNFREWRDRFSIFIKNCPVSVHQNNSNTGKKYIGKDFKCKIVYQKRELYLSKNKISLDFWGRSTNFLISELSQKKQKDVIFTTIHVIELAKALWLTNDALSTCRSLPHLKLNA